MKKFLAVVLTLAITLSLAACGGAGTQAPAPSEPAAPAPAQPEAPASAADGLAYTGDLTVMHFSTFEESQGNGGSDGFRTVNQQWDDAYPNINLVQDVMANDEYKNVIAARAAAGDMPDVFLLQGMNTGTWANQGLILDLTDIIKSSPYADTYDMSKLFPFHADGRDYAFPVLTEGSCTMVIYDKQMWSEAGFGEFPGTWDEVITANEHFSGAGIDTIAFGNSGKWQANSCFITSVGNRFTGHDWFYSMVDKSGAAFTDQPFVDALKYMQDIFQSGVFNRDFNAINNEDARELYIAGKAASFIGGNWDTSYVYATLLEGDPAKLDNTYLAVIPQPAGATATTATHATGMGYGIAINANLSGDKLDAAIDYARYVTGPEFAKFVAENYALSAFSQVSGVDLSKFDRFTQDFYKFYENEGCEIYDSYLTGEVWDVFNTDLQNLLNGQGTPEQMAANAQAAYESSYLS